MPSVEDQSASTSVELERLTEVSRRRAIVNAASNYGKYALTFVINVFLQAYVIRKLGKIEYSLWPLVSTITGIIALIPVGIGSGASRFLAHALANRETAEIRRITSSVFAALVGAAFVYTICVIVVGLNFDRIFDVPSTEVEKGRYVMLIVGFAGAIRIPFAVFQGGLNAAQQYVAINLREAGLQLLRAVFTVFLFTQFGPSLIWVAAVFFVIEVMGIGVTLLIAARVLPWQRIDLRSFDWGTLRTVSSFSWWVFVANVAAILYWKTDYLVINKLLEPTLLTGYSVVAGILLQVYSLAMLGSGVLIPIATILHARNDSPRIARMIFRANRVTVALGVPPIIFLALFGPQVLVHYLGSVDYASFGALFPLLGFGMALSLTQVASGVVPQACGKVALNSTVSLLVAVINVAVSVYFVEVLGWGLWGVAAGTAIVMTVNKGLFWPWYAARLLDVRWGEFFMKSLAVPLGHCLPVAGLFVFCRLIGLGNSLSSLLLSFSLCMTAHMFYTVRMALFADDRLAFVAATRSVLTFCSAKLHGWAD